LRLICDAWAWLAEQQIFAYEALPPERSLAANAAAGGYAVLANA